MDPWDEKYGDHIHKYLEVFRGLGALSSEIEDHDEGMLFLFNQQKKIKAEKNSSYKTARLSSYIRYHTKTIHGNLHCLVPSVKKIEGSDPAIFPRRRIHSRNSTLLSSHSTSTNVPQEESWIQFMSRFFFGNSKLTEVSKKPLLGKRKEEGTKSFYKFCWKSGYTISKI